MYLIIHELTNDELQVLAKAVPDRPGIRDSLRRYLWDRDIQKYLGATCCFEVTEWEIASIIQIASDECGCYTLANKIRTIYAEARLNRAMCAHKLRMENIRRWHANHNRPNLLIEGN